MFREDKVCFYPQTIQNYLTKWPETGPNPWFCRGGGGQTCQVQIADVAKQSHVSHLQPQTI